jgi:raffinose/stachyose/melibiose transport system permease protein
MIFLESKERMTIPVGLNNFRGEFLDAWHVMLAGVVIACIPMIALFLLLQKQFVRGLASGSVKG